ncbi:MAG: hypothetical protein CL512_06215, partial [Actinobacteria bacterium]|nr:hypothetical protein [Actinomycetota bacterium]
MGNSVDLEILRDDRLTPVIKSYVQVLNKLCELPDLKDDWERHDNLISNDAENDQIKTIQNEIFERNKSFIHSGNAGNLGTHLSLFWDEFWTRVLQKNRENGSVLEPDDKNISGWTGQTGEGALRDRIRDNEDEALEYLKVVPAFSEEAQSTWAGGSIRNWIRLIPPFSEINPRDLRNQLVHNSMMDRNFNQDINRKRLFVDPAYLKLGFTDYQRMVEICFKIISEDFSKSQMVELNRQSELEEELTKKALYSNSMMKSRIKNLEWDPETYYVDPSDDGMTVQNLANKIERNTIVQLFGIGGLGKTVLAYKYILENLDGEMKFTGGGVSEPIEPYDSIFFLSSKDWPQGEQDTVDYAHESDLDRDDIDNRKNPRSGKNSAARFHKDGKFEFFIDEICAHSPQHYVDKDKQTKAYEYIRDNHILIVLDNFEDVQDLMGDEGHEELEKYTQFFNRFRGNEKGKIIITTRQQYEGIGSTPFELKPVSKRSRVPLIKNRAKFLAQEHQVLVGPGIREWIFTPSGDDRIELFDQVAGELGDFFEENLGYPHVIFAFTRRLMDKSRDIRRGVTTENLIQQVATEEDDDGRSFVQFVRDQWEWSIKKGFTHIKKDKVCMAIMAELWKTERGLKFGDLVEDLEQFTLSQHRDAIKKLNLNGVFIETDSGRDSNQGFIDLEARIRLKKGARYYLGQEAELLGWKIEENTEPLSNSQSQDLELLRQLNSAINNNDGDGINKILGRLLKDGRVRLSRRKPVHQGITDFACRLLEELKKNVSRGEDKYSIPEDSIQGFEIEVLNACIALSKQEGADKSKFIDRALRIIEASDETDISHLGEFYQPIIQQLWEGDEAENLTPNNSPPTWAERLARLLAKSRFQPGIDNGGIELMYEWVTICDALDSSNSISKYDE